MFIYCADSYCLSFLFSALSAYFIINYQKSSKNKYIGIGCGILSLSIYQAYIAVTITLIFIDAFIKILKQEEEFKKNFLSFIIELGQVLVSMILYFVITKIILHIKGIPFASYKGANSLSILEIFKNLPRTIKNSYITIFDFLFREQIIYNRFWHRNLINIVLCILNIVILIYFIYSKKINKKLSDLLLALGIILLFPLSINIISIIMPDTGTNIITGPALILIYILAIKIVEILKDDNKIIKLLSQASLILIILISVTYVMSDNATYLARDEVYKNYYAISSNILNRVQELDGYSDDLKWIFTDNIRYKSKLTPMSNGVIANDYETWNNIDGIWMNYQFYDRYLGTQINLGTKEDYFYITEKDEYKNMPEYPKAGSIKIIDEFIVIKIGQDCYKR